MNTSLAHRTWRATYGIKKPGFFKTVLNALSNKKSHRLTIVRY